MHEEHERWADAMRVDPVEMSRTVGESIVALVRGRLRKRGIVVGLSGGVDSSVVAALAVHAMGPHRVIALAMPERDSSPESLRLAASVARKLGIELVVEDIGPALEALGCYRRQVDAIRDAFPDYGEGWKHKLVIPSLLEGERLNVFRLVVESPEGWRHKARLSARAYAKLVAATSFKQRTRKTMEYYWADRLGYAVAGTPNRLEYDQGFFVKHGDGAADVKPIAHLYKTQVYALAEHFQLPEEVCTRPPTTDTFSMPQTQEEFYFALPYREMDLCLLAHNLEIPPSEVARSLRLTVDQVDSVWRDIEAKRRATRYLHTPPLLPVPVPEVRT